MEIDVFSFGLGFFLSFLLPVFEIWLCLHREKKKANTV